MGWCDSGCLDGFVVRFYDLMLYYRKYKVCVYKTEQENVYKYRILKTGLTVTVVAKDDYVFAEATQHGFYTHNRFSLDTPASSIVCILLTIPGRIVVADNPDVIEPTLF